MVSECVGGGADAMSTRTDRPEDRYMAGGMGEQLDAFKPLSG